MSLALPVYQIMPECTALQSGDEWHPFKTPSLDGRGKGRVKINRLTPTPPASPERLAMAGRLNPPPSRGRRCFVEKLDAPPFRAVGFTICDGLNAKCLQVIRCMPKIRSQV
jgi:hypothetical protein